MDNHPKPNWSDAPPDAQAGIGASEAHYAAWYKRKGTAVYQICPAGGVHEWTWMGGRTDFPYGHEIRPASKKVETKPAEIKSVVGPDLLLAALKDCVSVMERDLNGLALIQPELKQAKQAIDLVEIVDADFVEWNGEGLPPVGTVCEFAGGEDCPHDPWDKDLRVGDQVTIIAHFDGGNGDQLAAFTFPTNNPNRGALNVEQGRWGCFSPILTPEQIAADERIASAYAMCAIAPSLNNVDALALYDASYRKQVSP